MNRLRPPLFKDAGQRSLTSPSITALRRYYHLSSHRDLQPNNPQCNMSATPRGVDIIAVPSNPPQRKPFLHDICSEHLGRHGPSPRCQSGVRAKLQIMRLLPSPIFDGLQPGATRQSFGRLWLDSGSAVGTADVHGSDHPTGHLPPRLRPLPGV